MALNLNPQTAGDYGALIGSILGVITFIGAAIAWPFKTFITKRQLADHVEADIATFVKKVEPDGTRQYVHPKEWEEMKARFDKACEVMENKK